MPVYAFRSPAEKTKLLTALQTRDDTAFRRVAVDRILSDPATTISTWASRYWRLWIGTRTDQAELRLVTGSTAWVAFKSVAWGLNLALLVAGSAGLIFSRMWVWAIPVIYVALIYVPFHNTETRYSLPALALLLIPLGHALGALIANSQIASRPRVIGADDSADNSLGGSSV